MEGWTSHRGLAVGLDMDSIDTDQLIPARFMSTPRSAGYGGFLLHDLRYDADGHSRPDFPLHAPEARGASILIARRNFGGGSSREAAVYALVDAGFRAVLAPSFGDIFVSNATNNGLLAAVVTEPEIDRLMAAQPVDLEIDIEAGTVAGEDASLRFELDPFMRDKLKHGWDDIDVTLGRSADIECFAFTRRRNCPWLWT